MKLLRENKVKILLCLIMLLAIAMLATKVSAASAPENILTEGRWSYIIENDTVTIKNYDAEEGTTKIEIPSEINGYKVTKIGNAAMGGYETVKEITIPNTITEIGYDVFSGNTAMEELVIPESVTKIGSDFCNSDTSLKKVKLPSKLTTIEWHTFAGCSALEEIEIPETVTSIGWYAMYDCDSLTKVTIPESVTNLAEGVLSSCDNLKEVTILGKDGTIHENSFGSNDVNKIKFNVYLNSTAHAWVATTDYKYSFIENKLTDSKSKISLSLATDETATLKVEELNEDSEDYKKLLDKLLNAKPIYCYNISVVNGKYEGNIGITFEIGEEQKVLLEGKEIIILHRKANGEIEEFRKTVKDGKVTVTTTELSPFMLAIQNNTQTEEQEETTSTETTTTGATNQKELDDTPKTGINDTSIYVVAMLLLSAAGIIVLKKNK